MFRTTKLFHLTYCLSILFLAKRRIQNRPKCISRKKFETREKILQCIDRIFCLHIWESTKAFTDYLNDCIMQLIYCHLQTYIIFLLSYQRRHRRRNQEMDWSEEDEQYSPGISVWKGTPICIDLSSDDEEKRETNSVENKKV